MILTRSAVAIFFIREIYVEKLANRNVTLSRQLYFCALDEIDEVSYTSTAYSYGNEGISAHNYFIQLTQ